jgi:hypothetical protein
MSSQGGLSRRRVANQSTSSTTHTDPDSNHDSRNGTTTTSSNQTNTQSRSHAGSAFRGGGGIAYDPRDLNVDEEDGGVGKLPRLTIMEEVLLLGLKDKQVSPSIFSPISPSWNRVSTWGDSGSKSPQFLRTPLPVQLLRPF